MNISRNVYYGLSTEPRPTNPPLGSTLTEVDTGISYTYQGSVWLRNYPQTGDPRVLFDDDFSDGLQGWGGLRTTGKNFYPSLHPASLRGPHSMILDTSDDGSNPSTPVDACKRLWAVQGRVRWRSRFAWNFAATDTLDLSRLRFIIDWQLGQTRRWLEISYLHNNAGAVLGQWRVSDGSTNPTNIAGLTYILGPNMIYKHDFHEIVIEAELGANPKWIAVELDDRDRVDLSAYPINSTIVAETDFENGSNFIYEIVDAGATADPYMLVDTTRAERVD